MSSVVEQHDYKNLKITFGYKSDRTPYASVLCGQTLLKFFTHDTIEDVKNQVRAFLKDPEKIRKIIKEKHVEFLRKKGIANPEEVGIMRSPTNKRNRETHCYNCSHQLTSYDNLTCTKCSWLLCSCGACGCGYSGYNRY